MRPSIRVFFLMIRRPRRSTQAHTLFPYTPLFRSKREGAVLHLHRGMRLAAQLPHRLDHLRSEEHTSELQSRELIPYAVFCLKKKTTRSPEYSRLPICIILPTHYPAV